MRNQICFFKPSPLTRSHLGEHYLKQVIQQLEAYSGQSFRVSIVPHGSTGPASSHHGGIILVDEHLLTKSLSAIAFIMAHEWGHLVFGHVDVPSYLRNPEDHDELEREADRYAAQFQYLHSYPLTDVFVLNSTLDPEQGIWRNARIQMEYNQTELMVCIPAAS